MNGKGYSEGSLSMMIDAANQYIDAPGTRDNIIAKCHQELGLVVAGAPVYQRAAITLTNHEVLAMRQAIHRWRRAKKRSRDQSV